MRIQRSAMYYKPAARQASFVKISVIVILKRSGKRSSDDLMTVVCINAILIPYLSDPVVVTTALNGL